ncbi:substrate-binding domain-containing protein [Streptomyces tsukubensis]|uniref:Sugar ABC transporter substrate-binding protein n=1 Tax=Streptomyces tsukubensis TaxID=83656 RepID=A0A1V4ADT1_9ACTN|nr:substrate-binding domain-containing protein [Streptomyces tsukubensis]OON81659.1 sugar ABC transporter substrate-binding protein [Streptomyces tsukubensis]QFR96434.1 substrate-binding domain-containing protein [Streptomyces tsukubensis]
MGSPGRRAARAAVALVAVAAAGAACGARDGDATRRVQGPEPVRTPTMTVVMVTHAGDGDTFWDVVRRGARDAAIKDRVRFRYRHSEDGPGQASLIRDAVRERSDGIITTLAKPAEVRPALTAAVDAGVPVVTVNSGARFSREYGALAHIGQDEGAAGEAAGDELNKHGLRSALCVLHEQGSVALEERCAGVRKAFRGTARNLNVRGTDLSATRAAIAARLRSDGRIDAVVTLGAPFAAAAVAAKHDAGSRARVGTFDLNAEVVGRLGSGTVAFAVDQQPYLQGYLAVDQLWLHARGAGVVGGGRPVLTGPTVVTGKEVPRLDKYVARGTR